MARRRGRRKRGGSHKLTIPIAPIVGIIAAPGVTYAINATIAGNIPEALNNIKSLVGFGSSNQFDLNLLKLNMTPIITGMLVHKAASMVGLNRMLAASRIPLVRI